jgi:hypothetical protein
VTNASIRSASGLQSVGVAVDADATAGKGCNATTAGVRRPIAVTQLAAQSWLWAAQAAGAWARMSTSLLAS